MNSNTICLRLFFLIFVLIVGPFVLYLYALRFLTPLAICLLPTQTAQAHYTNSMILVEYTMNSTQRIYRSHIAYDGHAAQLLTTSPPTEIIDRDSRDTRANAGNFPALSGVPGHRERPPELAFPVRYVRLFPSLVVRDLPQGGLWSYYADTWTAREAVPFFIWTSLLLLVGYFAYRHFRKPRRYSYR